MTLTSTEAGAAVVAARADLAQDFADMGAWALANLDAEIPSEFRYQVHVPEHFSREEKLTWLRGVARSWGTEVVADGYGGAVTEKRFGRVRLVASVAPEYRTLGEYLRAARARQAAAA